MKYAIALGLILFHISAAVASDASLSIYRTSAAIDGSVIAVTSLGSIVPQSLNSTLISPKCPCDSGDVNAFDRMAIGDSSRLAGTISDYSLGLAVLGPPLVDLLLLGAHRTYFEDMAVYSEVLSVTGALVTAAKYTVQRPIPLAYSGDPALVKDPNSYVSFFSGHTSLAFAALSAASMTADLRYHAGALPWVLTTALGGSIAYERVAAGRHFPTDVVMGAMVGTLDGVLIPLFHSESGTKTVVPVAFSQNALGLVSNIEF